MRSYTTIFSKNEYMSHVSEKLSLFVFKAYNGHTECLQLLLNHAEAEDVVDCVDGQDRLENFNLITCCATFFLLFAIQFYIQGIQGIITKTIAKTL